MEGVSLLEILIWVSPNKSGIVIPFCLQSQNSTSYQNLIFCLHGNENTRFYFTKTKQNSYYLNLFHESIYFRIYVGFPHPGLNVSPNIFSPAFFLVSTDARNSPSVCSDLPMWSTVMRTTVLYYFICNAYIYTKCMYIWYYFIHNICWNVKNILYSNFMIIYRLCKVLSFT